MKRSERYKAGLRASCVICMLMTALLTAGCAKKMDRGDPGPLLMLLKCMNSTPAAPVNNEFSGPARVTISGYSGHAMEPFISRDGNYLFFNSLNDGQDTSLYYAARVDDLTFTLQGKISGVNGAPPHLDAVASMDQSNKFYFVSTRNYPADYFNLFSGAFTGVEVTGLSPVAGNFYIESPGWLIMDAEISPDGNDLYYVNAHFGGVPLPDRSDIGVAHLSAGSFIVDADSSGIMAGVNTGDCLEYAPSISSDGLELFFTRLNLCTATTEVLVAKRGAASAPFNSPERIGAITGFAEAPSLTSDNRGLYYHVMDNSLYTIYRVSR